MLLANTFCAFRHRDYFIFWSGLLLGHTGTLIQTTAQSWLIFQLTDSPFYLGLEGFCLGLPHVLFSAFGGTVVDRADRKSIFVVTQISFLLKTGEIIFRVTGQRAKEHRSHRATSVCARSRYRLRGYLG
jgi:hypothetical protein